MNSDPAPIHVGITELDPNSASKSQPNVFQVTFEGGGQGTEMTQLVINGSKAGGGPLAAGDVIFETASGGVGSLTPQPFTVVSAQGFQVTSSSVLNDSSLLTINLSGFTAGDTLIFSIGAAQVSSINPVTSTLQLNPIVTGADLQGAQFNATFVATGYSSRRGVGDVCRPVRRRLCRRQPAGRHHAHAAQRRLQHHAESVDVHRRGGRRGHPAPLAT